MAQTEFINVQGKVKWFRHNIPDTNGAWTHIMYLDAPSLEKMRELQSEGMKNLIRKDEDGWWIRFKRPTEIRLRTGRTIGFAPPEVMLADGTPAREINVGNGSDVTTRLEVYSHKTPTGGTARAARWLSSRIDNLIPFNGNEDRNEFEKRAVSGLDPVTVPPLEQ